MMILLQLQGGFPELATRILEQLAANAVHENRFDDASFFFFRLSMEALKVSAEQQEQSGMLGGQKIKCNSSPCS